MTQTITLQLPEAIFQRLQQAAADTHQPLESVLFQSLQGNLPPIVDDLLVELVEELSAWRTLTDEALWRIAREPLSATAWRRHQTLLRRNAADNLSVVEQGELARLRAAVDRFALRRAYALALLKWRGHTLPASDALDFLSTPALDCG